MASVHAASPLLLNPGTDPALAFLYLFPKLYSLRVIQPLNGLSPAARILALRGGSVLLAAAGTAGGRAEEGERGAGGGGGERELGRLLFHADYNSRRHAEVPPPRRRTQAVAGQLGGAHGRPPALAEVVWARRNRLLQALEPHLSELARELLRKEYRKVLPKILEARGLYKQRFRAIERGASPGEAARTRAGFRECLEEKLHEISSGMLGELADRVALRL